MALKAHLMTLAAYHNWAYGRLYGSVDGLDDEAYRRPLGLFFDSIHRTLGHLWLVDELWWHRLSGAPLAITRLDEDLEPDRDRLRTALLGCWQRWQRFVETSSDDDLDQSFAYRNLAGQAFELSRALCISHVVNHGSHHRGQISTALTQLGQPAPVMDLPYFLLDRGPRA